MEFKIEEPTPATRRREVDPVELEFAEFCRQHQGTFVRFFKDFDTQGQASSIAQTIRGGTRRGFGRGFFSTTRSIEGKGVVYVKYVGDTGDTV